MDFFITAVSGLLIGVLITSIFMRIILRMSCERERNRGESSLAVLEEKAAQLGARAQELEDRLQQEQAKAHGYAVQLAESETPMLHDQKLHAEKEQLLKVAEEKLLATFKSLSSDALRSNNQEFLRLAQENLSKHNEGAKGDLEKRQQAIEKMVLPIRESLLKVDDKINNLEKARAGAYAGLSEQVKQLLQTSAGLQAETANLTKALRAPQVRGLWGEMQLRRTVEIAGMLDHCDFTEQVSVKDDEQLQRPDMLISLPNQRQIVVDAKVPISSYLEALESESPEDKKLHLVDHARQVREHLRKLGTKAYWKQFKDSPEFVVLFLPGEAFFSAALQADPGLIEYGMDNQTILATPTTLIALLKAVAFGWQQEAIAKEAKSISKLGTELYERIGVFSGHFTELRKGLDRATSAYNRALSSFETRFLPTARRLHEMDSVSSKAIETTQAANSNLSVVSAPELIEEIDA